MKVTPSKKIFRCAVLLIAVLSLNLYAPKWVQAQDLAPAQQETVTIETILVDVWPEYDRPSILVIYHVTLSSQTRLPAELTFRIPASAGSPHAVAMQDVNGLYTLAYETEAQGDWTEVTFTTPVPDFRVEYYDPNLTLENNHRSYFFHWPGDYTVNNLSLQVQQPMNASNMTFSPALGSGRAGQDGLTYYSYLAGNVNRGTEIELKIEYDKPDNRLTNEDAFQQVQPSQPIDSSTPGRVTFNDALPWVLGGLGIMLIAAGFFWYWQTGHAEESAPRARHGHARRQTAPASAEDSESVYCHQCGKRASPGDVFCRTCGTKLR